MNKVVNIPAPGGELSILMPDDMDEIQRLRHAKSILLGMIEAQDIESRPGISRKLLPSNKDMAKGLAEVAEELKYVINQREMAEGIKRLNKFWMNPWIVGLSIWFLGLISGLLLDRMLK